MYVCMYVCMYVLTSVFQNPPLLDSKMKKYRELTPPKF